MIGSRSSCTTANHADGKARSEPSGFSPKRRRHRVIRAFVHGDAVKRRRRNEPDSTRASSFLMRGRCSENISECRGEERRRVRTCAAKRETRNHHGVVKACSVDSSERSVHDVRDNDVQNLRMMNTRICIGLQRSRFSVSWGTFVSVERNDAAVSIRDYAERLCWHTSLTVPADRSHLARGSRFEEKRTTPRGEERITTTW